MALPSLVPSKLQKTGGFKGLLDRAVRTTARAAFPQFAPLITPTKEERAGLVSAGRLLNVPQQALFKFAERPELGIRTAIQRGVGTFQETEAPIRGRELLKTRGLDLDVTPSLPGEFAAAALDVLADPLLLIPTAIRGVKQVAGIAETDKFLKFVFETRISPSVSAKPGLVAAGKADIAITYQPQFILQIRQGLPLVQVGTLIAQPLNCLAVLKESSIHDLRDLKGKRIGYSNGAEDTAMLLTMLKHAGLSEHDVTLINVHYSLVQALLSKQVDAVTGFMRNVEPIELAQLGHPARLFYPENNGIPSYSELIFVTNKDKQHDPRIKSFLTALTQGTQYLLKHPDQSWRLFAKTHPELNNSTNKTIWKNNRSLFIEDPHSLSHRTHQSV